MHANTNALMHSSVDCNVEHMLELDGFAAGRWMIQGKDDLCARASVLLCGAVCTPAPHYQ